MWPFRKKQAKIKTQEDLLNTIGLFYNTFIFGTPQSVVKKVLKLSDKEKLRKKYGADYELLVLFSEYLETNLEVSCTDGTVSNSGGFGLIMEVKDLPLLSKYDHVFGQDGYLPMHNTIDLDGAINCNQEISSFFYYSVFGNLSKVFVKPTSCPYCGSRDLYWHSSAIQWDGKRVCCDFQYATPEDLYQMYKDFFTRGEISVEEFQKTHPTAIQIINKMWHRNENGEIITNE